MTYTNTLCLDKATIIWRVGYVPIIRRTVLPEAEAGGGGDLRGSHFVVFDMVGAMCYSIWGTCLLFDIRRSALFDIMGRACYAI